MQAEKNNRGQFPIKNATRYPHQLCKHFAHKIEVQFDETSGTARFPFGPATLSAAQDELIVDLIADTEEGLERGRGAIDG